MVFYLKINWLKIFMIYFIGYSAIYVIADLLTSKFVAAVVVTLLTLLMIYAFKRKMYKSLTFVWIISLLGVIQYSTSFVIYMSNPKAFEFFHTVNQGTFVYIKIVLDIICVILLKLAINYSKNNNSQT